MERLKTIRTAAELIFVGAILAGCGQPEVDAAKSVTQSIRLRQVTITRISDDKFLISDNGGHWGAGTPTHVGIEFMKAQGCLIIDVNLVNQDTSKVDVSNGKDCLPNLQ